LKLRKLYKPTRIILSLKRDRIDLLKIGHLQSVSKSTGHVISAIARDYRRHHEAASELDV